jgi:hypothetical protein
LIASWNLAAADAAATPQSHAVVALGDVGIATAGQSLLRYAISAYSGEVDTGSPTRICALLIASDGEVNSVKICALLLLGGVSLASVASAQSPASNPPPALEAPATVPASPPVANAPATVSNPGLPPQRVHAAVRASGFDPIGPPVRRGNLYVQRALDPNAVEYRVVVDSLTGRTLSVRPMRLAGPYAYGPPPYRPYPPPYRPAYGRYYGPPPDDFGYGAPHPPRNIPTARLTPPQPPAPPQPPQSRQPPPSTTAQAPLPRPKPYVMESTGSIPIDSPKPLASQKTPEPRKAPEPPAAAPSSNGAAALPPVAPLD